MVSPNASPHVDPMAGVRYEPCDAFCAGPDPAAGTCTDCGWFEEDHWMAELEREPALAS